MFKLPRMYKCFFQSCSCMVKDKLCVFMKVNYATGPSFYNPKKKNKMQNLKCTFMPFMVKKTTTNLNALFFYAFYGSKHSDKLKCPFTLINKDYGNNKDIFKRFSLQSNWSSN